MTGFSYAPDPIKAMLAIARQSDAELRHLRACPRYRIAWYRAGAFRAGCADPRLGAVVMGSIGLARPPAVARQHLERCLGCRLLMLDARRTIPSVDGT